MLRSLLLIAMCSISKYTVDVLCDDTSAVVDVGYSTVTLTPPGYPDGYDKDMLCSWISRPLVEGDQLLFMIIKMVIPCMDVISVYDGVNKTGTQLVDDKCTPPDSITTITFKASTSGSLYIEFKSDSTTTAKEKGFEVKIISGKDFSRTNCSSTVNLQASTSKQYISSPNFPQKYAANKKCSWVISTDEGKRITLNLVVMDIEYDSICQFDYLKITDGDNSTMFCQEERWTPYSYTSNETTLRLDLKSDNAVPKRGFLLSYQISESNGCTRCSEIMISKSSYLLFIIVFVFSN